MSAINGKTPPARPIAGGVQRYSDSNYNKQDADITRPKRLAPYARQLDPSNSNSIAVLTGSEAWERARSSSGWFQGARLLIPFGNNPSAFIWPVKGRDCILFSFGEMEAYSILVALSIELVQAGAIFAIWAFGPTPSHIFRGKIHG